MKEDTELNKLVSNITKWLDIETLDTQHCGEDFHELAVWQIKEIIEESYKKGAETARTYLHSVELY
jgi:hypothetical protein